MATKPDLTRLEKVFAERLRTLREDGFRVQVESYLPNLWFVKMRHSSNGNRIILRCWPAESRIEQERNHIVNHSEIV